MRWVIYTFDQGSIIKAWISTTPYTKASCLNVLAQSKKSYERFKSSPPSSYRSLAIRHQRSIPEMVEGSGTVDALNDGYPLQITPLLRPT